MAIWPQVSSMLSKWLPRKSLDEQVGSSYSYSYSSQPDRAPQGVPQQQQLQPRPAPFEQPVLPGGFEAVRAVAANPQRPSMTSPPAAVNSGLLQPIKGHWVVLPGGQPQQLFEVRSSPAVAAVAREAQGHLQASAAVQQQGAAAASHQRQALPQQQLSLLQRALPPPQPPFVQQALPQQAPAQLQQQQQAQQQWQQAQQLQHQQQLSTSHMRLLVGGGAGAAALGAPPSQVGVKPIACEPHMRVVGGFVAVGDGL